MKTRLACLAVLLMMTSLGALARSSNTVTFTGRIIAPKEGASLAKVVPEVMLKSDGSSTTSYVVKSTVTGATLATFTTQSAADTYATQVTPAVAYRE